MIDYTLFNESKMNMPYQALVTQLDKRIAEFYFRMKYKIIYPKKKEFLNQFNTLFFFQSKNQLLYDDFIIVNVSTIMIQ